MMKILLYKYSMIISINIYLCMIGVLYASLFHMARGKVALVAPIAWRMKDTASET